MKSTMLMFGLFAGIALHAQSGKPPVSAAPAPTLTPKETMDTLKLALALETEKALILQIQGIQAMAAQQEAPLRQKLNEENAVFKAEEDAVRKREKWGDDVTVDLNAASPTFGQWIKTPAKTAAKK